LKSGVCVFLFTISDRLSRHAIHLNNWFEFPRPPLFAVVKATGNKGDIAFPHSKAIGV